MACRKYLLTNNTSSNGVFSYQECSNQMWDYNVLLSAGESYNIWLIEGTYSTAMPTIITVYDFGLFPFAVSPTPSSTNTPTPTQTPTNTATQTGTPANTPTNTPTPSTTPLVTTFNVTNSGASAYIINGVPNPTLNLIEGETYTFNIAATGHPFWIKTAPVTGTGNAYNDGVTNNGIANGTITFTVPYNAPSTLYYICQIHGAMQGVINIIDVPQPSVTPTETPTNTPTETPTNTPTETPTNTPTETPTNTPTVTTTPTPSVTPPPVGGLFFTMQEVVADVVLSGTGTVNVASLGLYGTYSGFLPFIYPIEGKFLVGSGGNYETYSGATLNPEVFGGGSISNADIKTGDNFGIDGFNNLAVPLGYSGGILNGTSTFTGTTLTTLGANPGTYLVQWGSSGASETITFEVI